MSGSQLLSEASVLFSHLSAFFSPEESLHPARFAHLHELTSLLHPTVDGPGLLLGESRFSQVLQITPQATRRERGNLLVVAPTRGGKGLLAVSQLLTWPHSVVVNDIKGELFAQTAGYRRRLGPVFVMDPKGVGHRYDPLQHRHTEDALLASATQLLFHPEEGEGAIFTQRAVGMLTQLFLAARKEAAPPLPYVRARVRSGLTDTAERLHALEPALATQLLDGTLEKADFSDRFLLSSWSTLTARLRPLLRAPAPAVNRNGDSLPLGHRLYRRGADDRPKADDGLSALAGARPPRPRAAGPTPVGRTDRHAHYHL
jgi:hypothetical protein